ncbi:beta-glucosidase [candidate division KSB1 bacterium]|nr:beta-glucosidase [candidate division KSB1 bacterium]
MSFPKEFIWGAAAASYQVEGGAFSDGKGLSVWDMMSRWPGRTWENNSGDVSCDHYHRYEQDVALMAQIGLQAYRLSICWPRVLPQGIGKINEKGIDFYDRLVDSLLAHRIQPWVTLFHWDYPYELFCRGGWLNPESPDWFAEYARVIADRLSDRVTHWMTQNEPQCFIGLGHQDGYHAPGLKLDFPEILLATHHALLAHGKAVQVLRSRAKSTPTIGAAPVGVTLIPVSNSEADIQATRKRMFSISEKTYWTNTWYADPMILGCYPKDGLELFGKAVPNFRSSDFDIICQPLDFYGANMYHAERVRALPDGGSEIVPFDPGPAVTTMDWKIVPETLYWGPRFLYERYKLPIVVTENGMANIDWIHLDGQVHDPQRIDFLHRYLQQLQRAIDDGVDARGYFVWSIMDNFEWAFGYRQRFGLIYVDYTSQKRLLKDSALWYKEVIASNGNRIGTVTEDRAPRQI